MLFIDKFCYLLFFMLYILLIIHSTVIYQESDKFLLCEADIYATTKTHKKFIRKKKKPLTDQLHLDQLFCAVISERCF